MKLIVPSILLLAACQTPVAVDQRSKGPTYPDGVIGFADPDDETTQAGCDVDADTLHLGSHQHYCLNAIDVKGKLSQTDLAHQLHDYCQKEANDGSSVPVDRCNRTKAVGRCVFSLGNLRIFAYYSKVPSLKVGDFNKKWEDRCNRRNGVYTYLGNW